MKHTTRIDKVEGTVVFLRNNTKWNLSSADATKVSMWSKFADIETEDFGVMDRGLTNLETKVFVKAEKL